MPGCPRSLSALKWSYNNELKSVTVGFQPFSGDSVQSHRVFREVFKIIFMLI